MTSPMDVLERPAFSERMTWGIQNPSPYRAITSMQ
jgi:hypothetical protein